MDLLRFIKSLEELLYEAITWLLFYPRTLWLSLRRPSALAEYTDVELKEDVREQFADIISPPLFLLLTLLLMHGIELAIDRHLQSRSGLVAKLFESDTSILVFRAVLYSLFPLVMARGLLKRMGQPVDRNTLRRPFYAQCFFTAPLVLLTSVGGLMMQFAVDTMKLAGVGLLLAAIGWYLVAETRWFRMRLGLRTGPAFLLATRLFFVAFLIIACIILVVILPDVMAILRAE